LYADYSVFASANFDPNDYANAVLAGEPYPPVSDTKQPSKPTLSLTKSAATDSIAKEDVSVAISKLTFGIDDVSKQIRNLVNVHHEDLLQQATNANKMGGSLTSIQQGLKDLDLSAEKYLSLSQSGMATELTETYRLRAKIHTPYESLQMHVLRLHKLHQASDVLRRTSRFVILARRLQAQMNEMNDKPLDGEDKLVSRIDGHNVSASNAQTLDIEDEKERAIAKAALSIAELVSLLEGTPDETMPSHATEDGHSDTASEAGEAIQDISLRSINAVLAYEPFIQDARTRVTAEMENMVLTGLKTLNQTLLASSLQTAYNLRVLPTLVQGLLSDLSQAVDGCIQNAFDLSRISKDALSSDTGTSPNPQQSPAAYRSRVRTEPTSATAPQYTTVLWARLESMFEEMTECCTRVYTLEKVLRMKKDTITQVVFLDEAMKLLENKPSVTFWTSLTRSLEKHVRDTLKGSSFLQNTLGNGYPRLLRLFHEFFAKIAVHTDTVYISTYQSPETVLVLRSISNIESLYLSRSTNKLNEAVGQAFSGGVRAPPGSTEGVNLSRAIANELDAARFDPLLVGAVAKIASSSFDMILSRTENLASRDRSAFTFVGPTASPQQINNGQLASFLYHSWTRLSKLGDEYPDSVYGILQQGIQNFYRSYERLADPMLAAIRRELSIIISSLHRIDFGKSVDPLAGMGRSSLYTKELTEKLSFFKSEVLSKYNVGEVNKLWITSIVKYVIKTFLLHASIVKPLGESGKLQLTSDMTEVEFALNAFMVDSPQNKSAGGLESIGSEYKALRAMRPLLFLENSQLTSSKYTAGLPVLIVLHHILVRSPIPLPHNLHGWQEAEYVRWVDEHSEMEAFTLIDSGLLHWEKITESEGKDIGDAADYVQLARTVLQQAQGT
ncbi:Conserved oligomeric Golgi complex subunit 5, partial [Leucoagaricus sp. SymC.cos]